MRKPLVFGIAGWKNSGKTTLVTALTAELTRRGLRVATIKHDGHDFEPDVPGTDSWKHRQAGAIGTAVFSGQRMMLTRTWTQPRVEDLMAAFPDADVILVEGMKDSPWPRVFCAWPDRPLPDPAALADDLLRRREEGS